jgi:hypothetical protein
MWRFKEIDFLTGDLLSSSLVRVEVPMKINISALEEMRFHGLDGIYIPPPPNYRDFVPPFVYARYTLDLPP